MTSVLRSGQRPNHCLAQALRGTLSNMLGILTLMLLVATLANTKWCKNHEKLFETLANGYSSESTQ